MFVYTLYITDIGEWFEGQIGDDIQSDADAVTSNATYFLESMLCMTKYYDNKYKFYSMH